MLTTVTVSKPDSQVGFWLIGLLSIQMNALFKIILYILFSIVLFFTEGSLTAIILLSSSIGILLCFPHSRMRRGIIPITILVLATFLGNVFFHPGKVIYEGGPFALTDEGVRIALVRSSRVLSLIVGAKLLTLTTPLKEIVDVLKRLFLPLERVKVPVTEFFDTVDLTLELLPGVRDSAIRSYRSIKSLYAGAGLYPRVKAYISSMLTLLVRTILSPSEFVAIKSYALTEEEVQKGEYNHEKNT